MSMVPAGDRLRYRQCVGEARDEKTLVAIITVKFRIRRDGERPARPVIQTHDYVVSNAGIMSIVSHIYAQPMYVSYVL